MVVLEEGGKTQVYYLDLAAKLDQTAEFECGKKWSQGLVAGYPNAGQWGPTIEFPAPFGRDLTKEEAYIADLDAKTGASLKLTVLNPNGRVWTMVAGGGASVVYADAIANLGWADEIANYGEYSGAPSEAQTYEYAKTILELMTRGSPHPEGKFLFIGGGIANFTNVASTFKGVVRALREFAKPILTHKVKIFVRRAGPNYQEGLRIIRSVGEDLGLDMQVFGPDMHVSGIVPLALKGSKIGLSGSGEHHEPEANGLMAAAAPRPAPSPHIPSNSHSNGHADEPVVHGANGLNNANATFSNKTRSFIYGMQPRAVQGMLDFDFMCKRSEPSVACMIYPFGGHHVQKFYWGTKETLIPVHTSIAEACAKFPEVDVVVNFASHRRYAQVYRFLYLNR